VEDPVELGETEVLEEEEEVLVRSPKVKVALSEELLLEESVVVKLLVPVVKMTEFDSVAMTVPLTRDIS
jgi:hypothetical protein